MKDASRDGDTRAQVPKDPAERATSLLPRTAVIVLACIAFTIFGLFLVSAVMWPERLVKFETPLARAILCLGLAIYAGLFFFVLFPTRYRQTWGPVKVVGPVALVFGLLLVVLEVVPESACGELFELTRSGKPWRPGLLVTTIQPKSANARVHLVCDEEKNDVLAVFVQFPPGESEILATLETGLGREHELRFRRGARVVVAD